MKSLLTAALLASSLTVAAHAASTPCTGNIVVDTVYQTSTGGGKFDYYFQIRNTGSAPIMATASFAGFPTGVSLFSPNLPHIKLAAHENKRIKFGTGTNSQINDGIVKKFYDSRSSTSGAIVLISACAK